MDGLSHMNKAISFNGNNLYIARTLAGKTLKEVAAYIGASPKTIRKYEQNIEIPTYSNLSQIALFLHYPITLFYESDITKQSLIGQPFCTSLSPITLTYVKREKYNNLIRAKAYQFFEQYFDMPSCVLSTFINDNKNLNDVEYIEHIANELRISLNLVEVPINGMLNLLQNIGFIVSSYECTNTILESISQYPILSNPSLKAISFNRANTNYYRIQFALAHELGHWVLNHLDKGIDCFDKSIYPLLEQQADRFARAFLLPKDTFSHDMYSSSIKHLMLMKKKWRVPLSCIIQRCYDLKILSEYELDKLDDIMVKRNFTYHEPFDDFDIPTKPVLFQKCWDALLEKPFSSKDELIESLQKYCVNLYTSQLAEILNINITQANSKVTAIKFH